MSNDHRIAQAVYAAKENNDKAEVLILQYIPFIRGEAARFMGRPCTQQDDEFSIAMIAFHEAILSYSRDRGALLHYAAMLIRSRLIDEYRKEQRHRGVVSLHTRNEEDGSELLETLADRRDYYEESTALAATQQEIEELSCVMARFGVSFSDVADQSPRQERTMQACVAAIRYARETPELLDSLLRTGKLPLQQLVEGSGADRKTLERHRKYVLAMLLIQTNGYEIIRGHLHHVWKKGGRQ